MSERSFIDKNVCAVFFVLLACFALLGFYIAHRFSLSLLFLFVLHVALCVNVLKTDLKDNRPNSQKSTINYQSSSDPKLKKDKTSKKSGEEKASTAGTNNAASQAQV